MDTAVEPAQNKMQPLEIVLYPDPFLKKPCKKVSSEELKAGVAAGWKLSELVDRMIATMYDAEGIGLAAPQVGVNLRLFIVDISKDKTGAFAVFNPVLSEMTGSIVEEEGCLSIPGVRAKVKRAMEIKVNGVNVKGEPIEFSARELLSRVCQHENDHLDGKLFLDHLKATQRLMIRRALNELEEDYEIAHKKAKQKG